MATEGLKFEVFTQIDRLGDRGAQLQCWDIVQTEKGDNFQSCQIQRTEWNHLHGFQVQAMVPTGHISNLQL